LKRLHENNTPQEYSLSGLTLNTTTLGFLSKLLEKNTSLLGLHLARKKLRDEDAKPIVEILTKNSKLQKLELEGNYFGPAGVREIAYGLAENNTLRYVDFESNPLGNFTKQQHINSSSSNEEADATGIKAIAEMLKKNKKLLSLNLGNTGIDEKAGKFLVDAMEINTTLINLELSENFLSVIQIRDIQKYLKRNKKAYDEERLREFKERKLMNEEDLASKNYIDIETTKKNNVEVQDHNKKQRFEERENKYKEMVQVTFILL
jgi:hypothetical protein